MSKAPGGLAVHAVVRNRRTDRALDALASRGGGPGCAWVEDGDLAAAVSEIEPGEVPGSREFLMRHGRIVEGLLRRSGVVPLPFGVVARDENAVRTLLRSARIPLVEALEFLDDHYEVRVHVRGGVGRRRDESAPVGHSAFTELRALAKAARILAEEGDALDAAFLVRRSEWIRFVERAADWETRVPGMRVDATGPWAAYDFVRVHLPGASTAPREGGFGP